MLTVLREIDTTLEHNQNRSERVVAGIDDLPGTARESSTSMTPNTPAPAITLIRNRPDATRVQDQPTSRTDSELEGLEGLPALQAQDRYTFVFRVVEGPPTKLEYHSGGQVWELMEGYGDVVINRVDIPSSTQPKWKLIISGQTAEGTDVVVSGFYIEDGVQHDFPPGQLGKELIVEIPNKVTQFNCLQHFAFTVIATESNGTKHEYDPLMAMALKPGVTTNP
ncbi:MAG: hypothetical protein K0V04_22730 [Deltaproteobacteria bacterium]|nr:hypothetical protein [Deltaproteobacteria bacterium]